MKNGRPARDVAARLREAGLRVTASRVAVLEEIEGNRSHPNAIDVHRALRARHPSLSLSTVYLTFEAFAKAGLLRRMPARDGRLRVDGVIEEARSRRLPDLRRRVRLAGQRAGFAGGAPGTPARHAGAGRAHRVPTCCARGVARVSVK